MAGAILACRQSVALSPTSPQGFSMLGLLLERSGDLEQAAAAYARVLKLAPGSRLEVESLDRIRATLATRRGEAPVFRFDGRELDEAVGISAPLSTPVPLGAVVTAGAAAVSTAGISVANTAPAPDSYPNAPRPLDAAMAGVVPNVVPNAPGPGLAAPNISAMQFDVADMAPSPWWQSALNRPTAFTRGLPLAAVAGLGLMFMIWGRGAAVSSYARGAGAPALNSEPLDQSGAPPLTQETGAAQNPSPGQSQNPGMSPVAPGAPAGGRAVAPGVAGPNDSFPITNRAEVPAPAAPNASGAPVPAPGVSGGVSGGAVSAPNPSRPSSSASAASNVPPRPQPVFPAERQIVPPASLNNLPPVRSQVPNVQSAPSVTLPRGGGGLSSSGGGPMNPTGSRAAGTITLSRPRYSATAAPSRLSNRAAAAEAAANRAAASGRPDTAIASSSAAIRNGEGTGWSYQTRALAFLERGDYSRAADDFQAAISAYRDQIARGERVSEAQAGLRASQSGLSLAQGNLRR